MCTELAICVFIALIIVAIWAWIGGWTRIYPQEDEREYWYAAKLACPYCHRPYQEEDFTGTYRVMSDPYVPEESPIGGAKYRCPSCLEIANFDRLPHGHVFSTFTKQHRMCNECGKDFLGLIDSPCPDCHSLNSALMTL